MEFRLSIVLEKGRMCKDRNGQDSLRWDVARYEDGHRTIVCTGSHEECAAALKKLWAVEGIDKPEPKPKKERKKRSRKTKKVVDKPEAEQPETSKPEAEQPETSKTKKKKAKRLHVVKGSDKDMVRGKKKKTKSKSKSKSKPKPKKPESLPEPKPEPEPESADEGAADYAPDAFSKPVAAEEVTS